MMKQIPSKRSLVQKARDLRDHLKWACAQIYIGIAGYLLFGWAWMKGGTEDKNGQNLASFVIFWTILLIFRAILTVYRRGKLHDLLQHLVFKEGLKLKIK